MKDRIRAYNELHQWCELRFFLEDYPIFFSWLNVPKEAKGLKLLDVACGQGFFLEAAEKLNDRLELYGLDYSKIAVQKARRRVSRSKITVDSAYNIPYEDSSLDYIVNLGSLEHFDEPLRALKEMYRVLKRAGKAMIIVPNRYYLGNIWRVLTYGEEDDQGQEGMTRFDTIDGWKQLFTEAGLDTIAVRGHNGKDHIAWFFKRKDGQVAPQETLYRDILNTFVKPLIPLNLSWCFVFFVRRQPK